ncbi:19941_t:CDS:2, partial [Racocetra persica]
IEQYHQFFLELFDKDPTLSNLLSYEQHHRLYSVLIAIEPSFADSLLDTYSALCGVINEQFPKGSTMNLFKLNKYEYYKEAQKKNEKDVQWHEFLKLDKKQYLNFRFLRGISLSYQPKGKAKEVIKEFNKANSIFLSSEADFVLCDWLISYCNSMDNTDENALEPDNLTTTDSSQELDNLGYHKTIEEKRLL